MSSARSPVRASSRVIARLRSIRSRFRLARAKDTPVASDHFSGDPVLPGSPEVGGGKSGSALGSSDWPSGVDGRLDCIGERVLLSCVVDIVLSLLRVLGMEHHTMFSHRVRHGPGRAPAGEPGGTDVRSCSRKRAIISRSWAPTAPCEPNTACALSASARTRSSSFPSPCSARASVHIARAWFDGSAVCALKSSSACSPLGAWPKTT